MQKRYKWWHAAALAVGANAVGALSAIPQDSKAIYEGWVRPTFAPPPWAFGPAWTLNNITSAYAGLRIINLPEDTPHRSTILALEGFNWAMYPLNSPLFFGLKSPVLGATHTALCFGTTAVSAALTARTDKKAAAALLPRLAWLGLATALGVSIAIDNPDPLFGGE